MSQNTSYATVLTQYKQRIDAQVAQFASDLAKDAQKNYTPISNKVIDAYNSVLSRGGKRIRGALVVVGYTMCGGTNNEMVIQAAAAIELLHTYILVLDDIIDQSSTRRGGATAHLAIANHHKQQKLAGDSAHFGISQAINAAAIGSHYAQSIIANLDVTDSYKLHAIVLVNNALVVTGHGQINDIFNEVAATVDEREVDNVFEWKTAHYTFLNPLQFGMSLAGANKQQLSQVYDYAMHAGRAFQITDDILGTFASEQEAGKDPMDDTREGKRTLLVIYSLQNTNNEDKNFLLQMLGNQHITQAEFNRIKKIYIQTGALKYAQQKAKHHIQQAIASLDKHKQTFTLQGYEFLRDLALSLDGRTT